MKSWDELITPEEKERMSKYKRTGTARKTAPSSRILAELGTLYGWAAVRDALENNISPSLMLSLVKEGRHLHNIRLAEQYRLTFECLTNAFSKHGDQRISRILDQLGKE
ncbi:MAG: hypothetical protein [Namikivirus tsukuho]|uniref:Uncharacterized protein n=1 Tax=Bacteriophage sp. TaxID=38018 RepID=A0ABY5TSR7_9VIRU|nr:MAG: hypothetical protein [Bacteriophage sp.]